MSDLAAARLERFSASLGRLPGLREQPGVCVFVCGSVARGDAHPGSDLDVYVVEDDREGEGRVPAPDILRVLAEVNGAARAAGFARMEGGYTTVSALLAARAPVQLVGTHLDAVRWDEAVRTEAFFFAARVLILVEGRVAHGPEVARRVVGRLFEWYGDQSSIAEDVERLWRKMVTEARRRRMDGDPKTPLHEVKLAFSRRLICEATAACIAHGRDVGSLIGIAPFDRLSSIAIGDAQAKALADARAEYDWFLAAIRRPDAPERLAGDEERRLAFAHGRRFQRSLAAAAGRRPPARARRLRRLPATTASIGLVLRPPA